MTYDQWKTDSGYSEKTPEQENEGRDCAATLRPCPFCGEPAETDDRRDYRNISTGKIGRAVAVYCTRCPADMTFCCEDATERHPDDLMAELLDNWNRRAPRASR
jgi:hypothetical protein